jgi:hypothetical protein
MLHSHLPVTDTILSKPLTTSLNSIQLLAQSLVHCSSPNVSFPTRLSKEGFHVNSQMNSVLFYVVAPFFLFFTLVILLIFFSDLHYQIHANPISPTISFNFCSTLPHAISTYHSQQLFLDNREFVFRSPATIRDFPSSEAPRPVV